MANQLIETYLELYTFSTKEKKVDTKLMSTILVGIHRAYPYSKLSNDTFEQHLQTLYTLVHHVNFRMSVVAMVLIKNIVSKRAQQLKCPVEDRFYNLIFGQLIRPELQTCSRQQAFANLVLNVINDDPILERKEAFVKRMLLVALNSPPEFALILLTTITKIKGFNAIKDEKETNAKESTTNHTKETNNVVQEEDEEEESGDDDQVGPSWVHKKPKISAKPDLLARNARAARSEHLSELFLLGQYYDPAVAELARAIAS